MAFAVILVCRFSLYDLQGPIYDFSYVRAISQKGVAEKSNLAGSVGVTVFLVFIGTNTNNLQQSLACSKTFPGTNLFWLDY